MSETPELSRPTGALLAALRAGAQALGQGAPPPALGRFDALARGSGDEPGPSFEEYSIRLAPEREAAAERSPWRETLYFDVSREPQLGALANARFVACAAALGVELPPAFVEALPRASAGPEVLQIVLGLDANPARLRLKYYLIYRDHSAASVEALHRALALDPLPPALAPGSVYILGVDFQAHGLSDFKLYVRMEPARMSRVIRNLRQVEALVRGSRYLVFQHCLIGAGRQVYFHASSAELLERWLGQRARRSAATASFLRGQLPAMNRALAERGHAQRLRPWILSLPYARGQLRPAPSNLYLHFSEPASSAS